MYFRLQPRFSVFFLVLLCFSLACGKKSLPKPPEERAPASVRAPNIEAGERTLTLKWQAPLQTASGDDLDTLASFNILRRVIKKDSSDPYIEIAAIDVIDDSSGEGNNNDHEYVYKDSDVVLGNLYEYLIVPRNSEGIEGEPDVALRVSFFGRGSVIETVAFSLTEPEV